MLAAGSRGEDEGMVRPSPGGGKSRSPYLVRPRHPNAESAKQHLDLLRTMMALDETCENVLWMESLLFDRNVLSEEEHIWRCSISEEMVHDMLERARDIMEVRTDSALIPLPSLPSIGLSPTQPMGSQVLRLATWTAGLNPELGADGASLQAAAAATESVDMRGDSTHLGAFSTPVALHAEPGDPTVIHVAVEGEGVGIPQNASDTVVTYATATPQSTLTGDGAASSGQGTSSPLQRVIRPAPPPARDIRAEFRAYYSTNENKDYTAQRNRARWEPHDDEGELPAGLL